MTNNYTAQEYIDQLALALKKNKVKDIDDILADYEDYFAQSKAKGYEDKEAISRLPSVPELADSYKDGDDSEAEPLRTSNAHPSSAQRLTLFGATLAGDILLFPVLLFTIVMLACFGIVGFFLVVTGPLIFIPDSMLGQLDVARPTFWQLFPTAFLFISAGTAIMGVCVALFERIYSAYRATIVVRRWLLLGKHSDHLKLVPSVSKQFRAVLYRITIISSGVALLALLILVTLSWFIEGTVNFPSTWNV